LRSYYTILLSLQSFQLSLAAGLVNAGKREKSERGGKPKEWEREGEEEAGRSEKAQKIGKSRRRIESVGQGDDTYWSAVGQFE
jgi:hypothetical protein